MWTIQYRLSTEVEGVFEWAELESFPSEDEARSALAEHEASDDMIGWVRLVNPSGVVVN